MNWKDLHDRFLKLRDITGAEKISSYSMGVSFSQHGGIAVHLGTYDVPGWSRHTYLGPFSTVQEAMSAVEKKIAEAESAVDKYSQDENID